MNGDGPRRASALVVEDDQELLDLLAFLVEQAGLTSLPASEPVTALGLYEKDQPSVALVDLNLSAIDGQDLHLTGTEFRLLHYLARHSNAVVPTGEIAKRVWGYDDAAAREVVRVTLHRLRRKIGDDAASPRLIHTVPGVGVRLRPSIS